MTLMRSVPWTLRDDCLVDPTKMQSTPNHVRSMGMCMRLLVREYVTQCKRADNEQGCFLQYKLLSRKYNKYWVYWHAPLWTDWESLTIKAENSAVNQERSCHHWNDNKDSSNSCSEPNNTPREYSQKSKKACRHRISPILPLYREK